MRLIGLVLALVSVLATPLASQAQQSPPTNVPRIGYLFLQSFATSAHLRDAFRQGLRDLGYVEGQNIKIELRNAEGHELV